jgi:hypothetical protein
VPVLGATPSIPYLSVEVPEGLQEGSLKSCTTTFFPPLHLAVFNDKSNLFQMIYICGQKVSFVCILYMKVSFLIFIYDIISSLNNL